MYCPAHFAESRPDALRALMRAHPLATLITLAPEGIRANPVPLLWRDDGSEHGVLAGHVARANPLWREFDASVHALAVFHGPQAYITPNWYATKRDTGKVVPTWNYAEVQARGPLRVVDDAAWLLALVSELTDTFEAAAPQPWQVSDAPADYIEATLRAVVGIEVPIAQLTGKWKVSQNQPAQNRAGVIAGLSTRIADDDSAMAALVRAAKD